MSYSSRYGVSKMKHLIKKQPVFSWLICLFVHSHLAHLALTISSQEGHVVDLIHHYKVLLLPLKVLYRIKQ